MNDKLFLLASIAINLKYLFVNRKIIKGRGNRIDKSRTSIYRKIRIYIHGSNNQIVIGEKCILRDVKIEINGNNNCIILGEKINIMERGQFLIEGNNCNLKIGNLSLFRDGSFLLGESDTNIIIGEKNFCGIVTFSTSDFHSIINMEDGNRINKPADILVGNNNWITNYVTIRKGAVVSNDSVIGTYSIVNW